MTLKTVSFLCLLTLFKPTQVSCQSSIIGVELFGKASYYENKFYGRKTASGEILKKNVLTCAHPTLPFGTMIEVTNLANNKWCIVRVNDRGPFAKGRVLDLSHVAAKQLDMFRHGIAKVKLTVVGENDTIYIERPDSMIKSAADLIVDEPEEDEVSVPLKPKPKTVKTKASKSLKKKRAIRRKKNTTPATSKSKSPWQKKEASQKQQQSKQQQKRHSAEYMLDLVKIREYGNIEFLAKQLVEGFITGLHKSPFHGFSVEFAEHRLYNTGESTRYIDWKVFGKTDRLYVKRYEEETNLRCHLLIDTSSSMYYPEKSNGKMTFSIMAAGALAYTLQKQRDAVSLTTFSEGIEIQTPIKSTPSHIHKIFLDLESLLQRPKTNKRTSVVETLHEIAEKIHKRSLVVIFSDMFDDIANTERLFSAMQHLRHNLHEVLLFHVTDKQTEEEFNFDERPYEFIDLETNERVKVQPSQVKSHYQTAIKEFYHDLRLKCGQYKIDFVEADIAQGFDQILSAFLVKRGKMK